MIFQSETGHITLARRCVVLLQLGKDVRIECVSGRLWLTEEHLVADIVLEAGESYRLTGPGSVVVQALRDALYSVHAARRIPLGFAKTGQRKTLAFAITH